MDANSLEYRILERLWERAESNPEISAETVSLLQNGNSRSSFGNDDETIDTLLEICRE